MTGMLEDCGQQTSCMTSQTYCDTMLPVWFPKGGENGQSTDLVTGFVCGFYIFTLNTFIVCSCSPFFALQTGQSLHHPVIHRNFQVFFFLSSHFIALLCIISSTHFIIKTSLLLCSKNETQGFFCVCVGIK